MCGQYFCTKDKETKGQINLLSALYDLKSDLLFKQNKTSKEWIIANKICDAIRHIEYVITNRSYHEVSQF